MRVSEFQAPVINAAHAAPVRAAQAGRPTAPPAQRADRVNLAAAANPFEGFAPGAVSVTVDRWRQGPNDSIERILRRQGYSLDEIYTKDANGQRLIERVAQANGLRDPNLIRPRSKLIVPSKQAPPAQATPPPAQAAPAPAQATPAPAQATPAPAQATPAPAQATPAPAQATPAPAQATPAPPQAVPPAATAPVVTGPATPPQNTNDTGGATVEIGLLLDGVNRNRFTRNEFQALNSAANQYTELRARSGKDGFSQEELMTLGKVEKQYGQMYTRFLDHDRSRIRFSGLDGQDPATRQRVAQHEEAGRSYDDLAGQRINGETFITRLIEQREAAKKLGEQ